MNKKICLIVLVALMTMLCGCNSDVPDLTEEQTALISEYATNLLVKHSELSQRNLLSQSELEQGIMEEEEDRLRKIKEDEIAQAYLNSEIEMIDGAVQEDGESAEGESVPTKTIAEFLEEDNFVIDYTSYELCDSYPEAGGEDFYMAMDATNGHQLCVVNLQVQNVTSNDSNFDMLSKKAKFMLRTEDGETVYSQATMLLDDLSSYRGSIPGNAAEQMVLVFEVKAGVTQMESAELVIKTDAGENVVLLY